MFILYAIVIGIAAGLLLGGRLDGLERLRLRWIPLALVGLGTQVVLFLGPVSVATERLPGLGQAIYVGSTALVVAFVVANIRVPGLALVALGAGMNLAAIIANGGVMPTTQAALAAAGLSSSTGYSNSLVVANPALAPLTDIFALPAGVPLANVFSIGDLLIGLGVAITIALAIRTSPTGAGDPVREDNSPV